MSRLRPSEWLILAYFCYVAILAGFYFSPAKAFLLAAAVAVVLAVRSGTRSIVRDFTPIAFTLAAYREMEWFAPAHHDGHLEKLWIVWDRRLLDDLHLRAMIESAGALLPSYFELCYLLVYGVAPVAIVLLLFYHRRAGMPTFWLAYLAGTLGVYALFPFFPVRAAAHGLPRSRSAAPDHRSAPPESLDCRRLRYPFERFPKRPRFVGAFRRLGPARAPFRIGLDRARLHALWISVAIATVYGRYHYAVDAAAGFRDQLSGVDRAAAVQLSSASRTFATSALSVNGFCRNFDPARKSSRTNALIICESRNIQHLQIRQRFPQSLASSRPPIPAAYVRQQKVDAAIEGRRHSWTLLPRCRLPARDSARASESFGPARECRPHPPPAEWSRASAPAGPGRHGRHWRGAGLASATGSCARGR